MDREKFIEMCDLSLKPVRNEFSFSQEKMAVILGISKKTLVEIEKGRASLGWAGSVVLCYLFEESLVLSGVFGGRQREIMMYLAFDGAEPKYPQARGGSILWKTIMENEKYKIQQNIITQHYRLVDSKGRRIESSIDLEDLMDIFQDLK